VVGTNDVAAGVGDRVGVVQYVATQELQAAAPSIAVLQQVSQTRAEQPTFGEHTKSIGVGAGVGNVPFCALLPCGQADATGHAVQVLLPSGQKDPAGHTANEELLLQ
jgi:hypothetical protein